MYFSLWIMAKPIKFITSQVSLLFNAPALLQVHRVHCQSPTFWPLNMNHHSSDIHYMIILMINFITWYLSQSGNHCLYIMTRDNKASILVTSFLQSKWSCLLIIFTLQVKDSLDVLTNVLTFLQDGKIRHMQKKQFWEELIPHSFLQMLQSIYWGQENHKLILITAQFNEPFLYIISSRTDSKYIF
jgi:hypothetical protein